MSDSVRPHRRQPTRLPQPWDSPGKSTGVGCQASLSISNSQNLVKLMFIESMMPSNHPILCHPLLPSSIFPSIRVFSNESVFPIRPKYWSSSSASVLPMNIQNFRIDWLDLLAAQRTLRRSGIPISLRIFHSLL